MRGCSTLSEAQRCYPQTTPQLTKDIRVVEGVHRWRAGERQHALLTDYPEIIAWMEKYWPSLFYLIANNFTGVGWRSKERDPRTIFEVQKTLLGKISLDSHPDAAEVNHIGALTGPYVGGEGFHQMLLMHRNHELVPSLAHLSVMELNNLHHILNKALQQYPPDALYKFFIGISISPLEKYRECLFQGVKIHMPRSSVQNIGDAHFHLPFFPNHLLVPQSDTNIKIDTKLAIEPHITELSALLYHLIYQPVIDQYHDLNLQYQEHTDPKDNLFPKGSFIIVPEYEFASPDFAKFMLAFLTQAQTVYEMIASCVTDVSALNEGVVQTYDPRVRKQKMDDLLHEPDFAKLPPTVHHFLRLFTKFRNPADMINATTSVDELKKIVESFVILGLAYNLIYYKHPMYPGHVVIAIVSRWMTDGSSSQAVGIFKTGREATAAEFEQVRSVHMQKAQDFAREAFAGFAYNSVNR